MLSLEVTVAENEHLSGDLVLSGETFTSALNSNGEIRDELGQLIRRTKDGVTVDWTPTMQFRYARRSIRSIDFAGGRTTIFVLQQYWTGHQWRDQQGPLGEWRDIPIVDE